MSEDGETKQIIEFVSEISNDVKDRLKIYDNKFNEMISNIDTELNSTKKESKDELSKINQLLAKGVEDLKNSLSSAIAGLQNDISETKIGIKKEYSEITDQLSSKVGSIEASVNETNDKFSKEMAEKDAQTNNTLKNTEKALLENLESKNTEIKEKIKESHDNLTLERNEKLNTLTDQISEANSQISEFTSNTNSRFDNIMEKLLELKESFTKDLDINSQKNQENIENFSTSTSDKLTELTNQVSQTKNEMNQQLASNREEFEKKTSELHNQQKQFFTISQNHSEGILSLTDVLEEVRNNYLKIFDEVKTDQKIMMESFQKIIVGSSENLRNEVIVFSKEVQRQLSGFEKNSKESFLLKSDAEKIDEKVNTLDRDLRQKAEAIRTDLVRSLDDNVKNFDNAVKDSLDEVQEVKIALEKYKDEIESMIERKVNEKFEFVQEILSNVVIKTEKLSNLVLDSKLKGPQVVKVPVKDNPE